ncbi:unnamed protein product [Caenorhabditis auriculariae]|uniref:Uncharacterized protein n=1 Tax=Caenorhabditis auriculariae TaxID=2777116 RepID=A0A8S1GUR9_9PELO|nr:unnamed protein product [Caenorhabditis auriculariae]
MPFKVWRKQYLLILLLVTIFLLFSIKNWLFRPRDIDFSHFEFDIDQSCNMTQVMLSNSVEVLKELPLDLKPTPPYADKHVYLRMVPKYKIASCMTPKTMTTVIGGVLCNLVNASYNEGIVTKPCEAKLVMSLEQFEEQFNPNQNWTIIFGTRDPIDRFLSAFIDYCIRSKDDCRGCRSNMTCLIEKLPSLLRESALSKNRHPGIMMLHFMPQTWNCDFFRLYPHLQFLRYSQDYLNELHPQLEALLRRTTIPDYRIDLSMRKIREIRSRHTTRYSAFTPFFRQKLFENPRLIYILSQIYHHDYLLLGYPKPTIPESKSFLFW